MESLLTVADAARLLRVSTRTVRRYIDRGELQVIMLGKALRIDPADVANLVERSRRQMTPGPAAARPSARRNGRGAPAESFTDRLRSLGSERAAG